MTPRRESDLPFFLTLDETRALWRVSDTTIRRIARQEGWAERFKIGGQYRIPRDFVFRRTGGSGTIPPEETHGNPEAR